MVFFSRVKCYCTYILIGLQCQIPCLLDRRSVHDKETHWIRCRKSKHTQAWWRYQYYHIVTSPGLLILKQFLNNFMLKLCYYLKVHLLCPEMKLEINKWETKRLVTGSCKITRFFYNFFSIVLVPLHQRLSTIESIKIEILCFLMFFFILIYLRTYPWIINVDGYQAIVTEPSCGYLAICLASSS